MKVRASWISEKINKTDKTLTRLTKKKRERNGLNKYNQMKETLQPISQKYKDHKTTTNN